MKNIFTTLACSFVLLSIAGTANAVSITRDYNDPTGSGSVTYTDLGGNMLEISLDNTTTGLQSSLISGLVFNILADIEAASFTIYDGNNNIIGTDDGLGNTTGNWFMSFNQDNQTTPNNTEVDLLFDAGPGVNGGIYNAANEQDISGNVFSDVARIVMNISEPDPWALETGGISEDFLRMQRTGLDGEGSLKTPGSGGDMPVPGTLFLLGLGLLGLARSRRVSA